MGFTLIELLIVVGVVAILSVAVVLAVNPTQLMAQGRDTTRLNDFDTFQHVLSLYQVEQSNFGTPNTVYVSIPDASLAPGATSTCTNIGLSTTSLPAGWNYQCVSAANLQKTDGTGWFPVNFGLITAKNPISQLPIDPINTTSSGNYYTYVTNGSQYEFTSHLESDRYAQNQAQDGGTDPAMYEKGTNLSLAPFAHGLVGYWNFDEGSGTTAYDQSGLGWNGVWNGSSSVHYGVGKVGNYSAYFDGTTDYVDVGNILKPAAYTKVAWVKLANTGSNNIVSGGDPANMHAFWANGGTLASGHNGSWSLVKDSSALSLGTWYFVAVTYNANGGALNLYKNGTLISTAAGISQPSGGYTYFGSYSRSNFYSGNIDEVRIYNRALSAAEIQALYNATK